MVFTAPIHSSRILIQTPHNEVWDYLAEQDESVSQLDLRAVIQVIPERN